MVNSFPLKGVIGIVANNTAEIDFALDHKLSCVEIRADLLINGGTSVDDVVELVRKTKTKELGCLFTLRHPEHGGEFFGTEEERVLINQAALEAGASSIDLEWGTEALVAMAEKHAPIVISHHDFKAMPSIEVLEELTLEMESFYPDAIKVVPTSSTLAHSVQMLQWVGNRTRDIARIGFAMGQKGTCSRIMTTVYGAPITYASFGDAVAPGQLSMDALINCYRVSELNDGCLVYGVAGKDVNHSRELEVMNQQLKKKQLNAVCIPLESLELDELLVVLEDLKIKGIQLENPLKEIAIDKFYGSGSFPGTSVFMEISSLNGKQEINIHPISGEKFVEHL